MLQAVDLNRHKLKIYEYVESRMAFIAPNLCIIVGASTAAKLMGNMTICTQLTVYWNHGMLCGLVGFCHCDKPMCGRQLCLLAMVPILIKTILTKACGLHSVVVFPDTLVYSHHDSWEIVLWKVWPGCGPLTPYPHRIFFIYGSTGALRHKTIHKLACCVYMHVFYLCHLPWSVAEYISCPTLVLFLIFTNWMYPLLPYRCCVLRYSGRADQPV